MTAIPAHQRIRNDIVAQIESGTLGGRERLPGEAEIAARYGVTRMTVRQALGGLVHDGMLVRRRGVGTFVATNAAQRRNMNRLVGFTDDMRASGRVVDTRILEQRIVPATAEIADAPELGVGVHVTHIGRLRVVDGTPVIIQHSWVPCECCPDLWSEPLIDGSLYATLRDRYGIDLRRADQRIAADAATGEHALLFGVPPRSPLLRVERVVFDERNLPVEVARSWTRPGYEIATHIER